MADIQDLLKLVDDDKALWDYLYERGHIDASEHQCGGNVVARQLSLCWLAFRLRDEAVKASGFHWGVAVGHVREYCHSFPNIDWFIDGWITHAEPKHFIVAALVAKRLREGEKT